MKNIFRILKIARPLYSLFGIIAVLILASAVIQQLAPLSSKIVVDEIEKQLTTGEGEKNRLFAFLALAFAASFTSTLITSITNRLGDHMGGQLRKYLTQIFYGKVLTLGQSYFDSELSGKIVHQLNRGITSIRGFANTSSNFILPTIFQTLITISILVYLNPAVAVCVILLFPVYLGLSHISTKQWGKLESKKNQLEDESRGRIQEVITNIRLVKSSTTEQAELAFIDQNQQKENDIYAQQSNRFHALDFLREQSLNLVILAINLVVFWSAFSGKMSFGEVILIIQLVTQARTPLFAMSYILTQIQTAESGSKEFFDIMNLESAEKLAEKVPMELMFKNPTVKFDHVSFNYEEHKKVIKDFNFTLKPGEKVALVGPSGAGKSTIVNLLLKLYDPVSGSISMDDTTYDKLSHQEIRKHIALVFQDNELFSTTIKDNVAYGVEASDDAVWSALKSANAADFVQKLEKGLESKIGERGVKLSGGQKQRLQIARAILKNAPILILDEATSSLDSKSEHEVQQALDNLLQGKSAIIIAHRLSTIQNVDRIIVIDDGAIVQEGSPAQLAQQDGVYRELLSYQVEGNKKLLQKFEIY